MADCEFRTVKILGQEWCKPVNNARLVDYITIGTGSGHAVLCRAEQDTETGEIWRIMLRPEDLEKADG